ncbi:MAG: hypothetical protein V3U60_05210 [Gammaproteobacteria bacterium]
MFMKTLHDQSDSDKRERMTRILVISAVLAALLVGTWQVINAAPRYEFQQALTQQPSVDLSGMPGSFADLIEEVKPAGVNISATGQSMSVRGLPRPDFENAFLDAV